MMAQRLRSRQVALDAAQPTMPGREGAGEGARRSTSLGVSPAGAPTRRGPPPPITALAPSISRSARR